MMCLRIKSSKRRFGLWLPLLLILPLAVALAIILIPLVLVYDLVQRGRGRGGKPLLLAGPAVCRVICALCGLEVDIKKHSEQVFLSFK